MPATTLRAQDLNGLPIGEHYDLLASGLIFFVQKRRRMWIMRPRVNGRRTRITLGFFPHMSLAAARDAAREVQAASLRGWVLVKRDEVAAPVKRDAPDRPRPVSPQARTGPDPVVKTLRQLFDDYEVAKNADPARPAMRTMKTRIQTMHRELKSQLDKPASALTTQAIIDARNAIAMRGNRVAANRFMTQLRAILKWATREHIIPANPSPDLQPFPENARERVLTPDEIGKVWAASLGGDTPAQLAYGRLVRFLLLTAQRRNEASEMTFGEIIEGVWHLPAERNKGKRLHCVPLTPRLLGIVGAGHPSELVFRTADGALSGWSDLKERFDARCGVTNWTLHDLRRTAATLLDNDRSVPSEVIERLQNHAIPGVGGIYRRGQIIEEKRAALLALENIIPANFR